jgi:hypothetical protein
MMEGEYQMKISLIYLKGFIEGKNPVQENLVVLG